MKHLVFIILLIAFPALAAAEPLYRWVDEDGTVHYSDKPVEGAEPVELRELSTYEEATTRDLRATRKAPQADAAGGEAPVDYASLRIVAPEHDSVVWVTGGEMNALVESDPPLQAGHRVALYVNGTLADGTPTADMRLSVTGMIRGSHQLVTVIVDDEDNELIRSEPITIHARAHSIHNRP